jgi:hypothetical protein
MSTKPSDDNQGSIIEWLFVKIQKSTDTGKYGVYVVSGIDPEGQWQGPPLFEGNYINAFKDGMRRMKELRELIDNDFLQMIVKHELVAPFDIEA